MKELKFGLIELVLLLFVMGVSFVSGRYSVKKAIVEKSDTVTVIDTFTVTEPIEVEKEVVCYKRVPVAFRDTVTLNDTVIQIRDSVAVIPISLKTYTDSSTYKAVVSGYDPRLESIEVYQKNTIITNTVEPSPWSFGLQGGVYMTPAGVAMQQSITIQKNHT